MALEELLVSVDRRELDVTDAVDFILEVVVDGLLFFLVCSTLGVTEARRVPTTTCVDEQEEGASVAVLLAECLAKEGEGGRDGEAGDAGELEEISSIKRHCS